MESLNNYIVERIRIDNVKHPEFPINGTLDEVTDFLKEREFKEIKGLQNLPSYERYAKLFNKYKNKCFFIEKSDALKFIYLYFANTSDDKISESNMLYIIKFDPETSTRAQQRIRVYGTHDFKLVDDNEFEQEMESYFLKMKLTDN